MDEIEKIHELERLFENFKFQLGRFSSDVESEKQVRKERNDNIDKRLKDLEVDKIQRDTTNKLVFKLLAIIWALAGSLITIIVTLFFKK